MRRLDPPQRVHADGDVAATLAALLRVAAREPDPDLSRPPFGFLPGMAPHAVGRAIATTYDELARGATPTTAALIAAACDRVGCAPAFPERAAALVASVLAAVPSANAYHNANHTREVVASAIWLSEANAALVASAPDGDVPGAAPLAGADVARLLLLAAMHDIGHDGGSNVVADGDGRRVRVPHRLEDRSFGLMEGVLARAGIGPAMLETMRATIRATDAAIRPAARAATDHVLWDAPAPQALPPQLTPLLADRVTAAVAALLADADILSSAALTLGYQATQNARLEAEAGSTFAADDVLAFFDVIVGGDLASAAGRLLSPNLRAIRADVAAKANDGSGDGTGRGAGGDRGLTVRPAAR